MKTRLMIRVSRWVATTGAICLLAASVLLSGVAVASDADEQPFDQATQAAWLQEHFRCEHFAELEAA